MSDEPQLRTKARECLESGRLPNRSPDRLYGGKGTGAECVICCEPVVADQVEFEVEFDRNGPHSGVDKYRAHLACLSAWELERRKKPGGDEGLASVDPVLKWGVS